MEKAHSGDLQAQVHHQRTYPWNTWQNVAWMGGNGNWWREIEVNGRYESRTRIGNRAFITLRKGHCIGGSWFWLRNSDSRKQRINPVCRRYKETLGFDALVLEKNQAFNPSPPCFYHRHNVQSWGFLQLYSINVNRPNNNADSDRGRSRGLSSPHGRRGAICAHMGWTYRYLTEGISWALVQKMMMDAPSYDSESSGETEIVNLEKENANDIMNYVNSLM